MSRILRLLAILVLIALIAFGWFWWNQPQIADMAANVPADSLVYLETNSLTDVGAALASTDAWQRLEPLLGSRASTYPNRWLTSFIKTTGIGSTSAVIATRAQAALVLLDLSARSAGDTLEYKPQAALIVETHTGATRIKPAIEKIITDLAHRAYGNPQFERVNVAGSELSTWSANDRSRQIVASFDGSVVIVGNDQRAVLACLAARRGERPSLQHQPDLEEMRSRLHSKQSLAFGYVSSTNAARLVSDGAPILLGKIADNSQLQKLLGVGAGKVLGTVAWSAHPFGGGIEDSYFLTLKPAVVTHLRTPFTGTGESLHQALEFLPADAYSVTSYNLRDPSAAWTSLSEAISAQVDALSAVVFSVGFRALLAPYGIDEPESFLKAIKPEVLTVRLEPNSDRSVVIAAVADTNALHQFVSRRFGLAPPSKRAGKIDMIVSTDGTFAASFVDGYFLLGSPEDITHCLEARDARTTLAASGERLGALTHFLDREPTATIVTYTRENAPWSALAAIIGSRRAPGAGEPDRTAIEKVIGNLPYAITETKLGEDGFERRTRSAFGQFGTLLTLATPPSPDPGSK